MLRYYTEYLPRISTVSISFELEPGCSLEDITLGSDSLMIRHSKGEDPLPLSHRVNHPYNKIGKEYAKFSDGAFEMKLKCTDQETEFASSSFNHFMGFNEKFKWSAKAINQMRRENIGFLFKCAHCGEAIMSSDQLDKVRDLPSELWSEMFEFYICHRPADDNHYNFDHIKQSKNCVSVGNSYFLIPETVFDSAISVDSEDLDFETNTAPIKCVHCQACLGLLDFKANVKRLNKWSLVLQKDDGTVLRFEPFSYAYGLIMDQINLNGTRIFKINSDSKTLYVWVFNSGLSVSLTNQGVLSDCLKIYYTTSWDSIQGESIIKNNPSIQNLHIQKEVMNSLFEKLESTNTNLPMKYRKMGGWSLGFVSFN